MVEGVEEFGPELDCMILQDLDPFQNRDVPVELAGALNNTDTRIAVVRSVSDNGRSAKRAFVEIARAAACATQPLPDITRCGDVRVSHSRAQLGAAESGGKTACRPVDRPGGLISDRHGIAVLHHGNSGQIPSSKEPFHYASVRPERKVVAVVGHEALRPAELRRAPL